MQAFYFPKPLQEAQKITVFDPHLFDEVLQTRLA